MDNKNIQFLVDGGNIKGISKFNHEGRKLNANGTQLILNESRVININTSSMAQLEVVIESKTGEYEITLNDGKSKESAVDFTEFDISKGNYIETTVYKKPKDEGYIKIRLEEGKKYLYNIRSSGNFEIQTSDGEVIATHPYSIDGVLRGSSVSNILEPEYTGEYYLVRGLTNTSRDMRLEVYELFDSVEDVGTLKLKENNMFGYQWGDAHKKYAVLADKNSTFRYIPEAIGSDSVGQVYLTTTGLYRNSSGINQYAYDTISIPDSRSGSLSRRITTVDTPGHEKTYAHIHKWLTTHAYKEIALNGQSYTKKTGDYSKEHIRELKSEDREKSMVADPVDSYGGNFVDDNRVMISYGGINPLEFSVSYDSIVNESKTLGGGFIHNFETYLDVKEDGEIDYYNTPNSVIKTIKDDGKYLPLNSNQIGLSIVKEDNNYKLIDKDRNNYLFDLEGNLLRHTNKVGLRTNYERDSEDKLTKVSNEKGQEFNFTYNEESKLVKVSDVTGRELNLGYGSQGISKITLTDGTLFEILYDTKNGKVTELKQGGVRIVKNTYDSRGRVSRQHDGKGTQIDFSYDEITDDNVTTIIKTGNNTTQTKVHDSLGNLIKEIDGEGFVKEYKYDDNRNLISEIDKNGNEYKFEYDTFNNLTKEINGNGTFKTYKYDTENNLIELVGEDGKSSKSKYENNRLVEITDKSGEVIKYEYDKFGNNTKVVRGNLTITNNYDDNGNLISVENGDILTKFKVDGLGRAIETELDEGIVLKSEYDSVGNIIKQTDSNGNTTLNEYNGYGDLVKTTDSNGVVTELEYDGNGNITKEIKGNRTVVNTYNYLDLLTKSVRGNLEDSTVKNTETYTYNKRGELLSYRDADKIGFNRSYDGNGNILTEKVGKSVETFEYDISDYLIKSVDGNGNITTYDNDVHGNVIREYLPNEVEIGYEYDVKGRMVYYTDGNGNITRYEYDVRNNLTKETLPDGTETKYEYNASNQITKVINGLEEELSYEYNNLGQLIKVFNDNKEVILTYNYDNLGNVVGITNGVGSKYTLTYDLNGNVIKVIDALGNEIESNEYNMFNELVKTTNSLQNTVTNNYDSFGRLVSDKDGIGNITKYSYSNASRLTKTTDAIGTVAEHKYNDFGNIVHYGQHYASRTTYVEDNNQNIVKDSNDVGEYNYEYDNVNNLITKVNSRKQNISYEYDNNGNLIKETTPEGVTTYEYDSVNNLISSEDNISNNKITRDYDKLGRVISKTQNGKTIKYQYDNLGNLEQLTYSNNKTVKYSYDKDGNMLTVKDWNNKETKYEYDSNGRLVKTVNANGVVELRQYDTQGQLIKLESKLGEEVIVSETYEYDILGNIVKENDKIFKYDALNRLVETNNSNYTYSSFGNITEFNTNLDDKPKQLVMQYGLDNELKSLDRKAVQVDKDGNLLTYTLNGVKYSANYDSLNRMTSFDGLDYEYDTEGNRIKVSEDGIDTEFLVDNDNVNSKYSQVLSEETEGSIKYNIYGNGLIGTYEEDNEDSFLTNHYDIRGSTVSVTDTEGKVIGNVEYDEYGKILSTDEEITTRYLYNGKFGVATDDNGLNYMRNRYYNPDLKRFMNRDVVVGNIENSQTLNRYSFANGDPISYNDPFGLARESIADSGWLSNIQTSLDLAGFVPGLGVAADLLNATIYLGTGNYEEAIWSGIGAVPIVGDSVSGVRKAGKISKLSGISSNGGKEEKLRGSNKRGDITKRGSFRKNTVRDAWNKAEEGPDGGRLCPTCRKEVKVKPFSGVKRDWDVDHEPAWTNRYFRKDVTRKEVLDNYQEGTRLECPACNRSRGNRES